jgi:hypothetical protein
MNQLTVDEKVGITEPYLSSSGTEQRQTLPK